MEGILKHSGCALIKANSGEEALRCLLDNEFAVILMDVQMPGMDGFETAALIREREKSKHIPIIFITAVEKARKQVEQGYTLGAVDYILKPFEPSFLKTKVGVFVELHQMRMRDIEARKKITRMAGELARSNRELEEFAYIASHDLQEPLRKIKNFTELLARQYQGRLDEKADEFMYYITDGARRMQRLISGLLSYSRVTTRKTPLSRVDLNTLVSQVVNSIQIKLDETGASVTTDGLPTLKADEIQIGQVFQNLILNAVKFRGQDPPEIHISAQKKDLPGKKEWLLGVKDNGIGIEPENSSRIFEIFQRLHLKEEYPGDGMGLAICKKIVNRHGGEIRAESRGNGNGMTVYFTLPDNGDRESNGDPNKTD